MHYESLSVLHLLSSNRFIYTFFVFIIFLTGYHIPCFNYTPKLRKMQEEISIILKYFLKNRSGTFIISFFIKDKRKDFITTQ